MILKRILVALVFISLSFFAIGEGVAQQGGTGLGDDDCPDVSNCGDNTCIPDWTTVRVDCVVNVAGKCVCP